MEQKGKKQGVDTQNYAGIIQDYWDYWDYSGLFEILHKYFDFFEEIYHEEYVF